MKIKMIFFLVGLASNIYGQGWFPVGSEWNYRYVIPFLLPDEVNSHRITGDTIIENKTCQIFERDFETCDFRPITEYIYKEDGKLYYYESDLSEFRLLYDFSLEVGEVYKVPKWEGMYFLPDTILIRVDSIGQFQLGSKSLKSFYVSYGFPNDDGEIEFSLRHPPRNMIIEDIGNLNNFFYYSNSGACDGAETTGLGCFSHPEYGLATFDFGPCDSTLLSTSQLNLGAPSGFELYPNPVGEFLYVGHDLTLSDNCYFKIIDLSGRLVSQELVSLNSKRDVEINASNLNAGLYFLLFEKKSGEFISVYKFIKK